VAQAAGLRAQPGRLRHQQMAAKDKDKRKLL
jgi:hypothetical protein